MSRERYSDMNDHSMFGMLISALGGGGDKGNMFPQSDADDMGKGARFIPGEVTDARRRGETVEFNTDCETSPCCWFWRMPNGDRIFHYDPATSERIKTNHGGICGDCGNMHTTGGTIKA